MFSVSVIMPVYNNEQTLRRALDSILNQTLYNVEIILINDGSTDSTGKICEEYAKKEPLLVEVIHQPRSGFVTARNKGLRKATGKYIYFADAKHQFDNRMFEVNVKLAEEKDAELVVFGFTTQSDENGHQNEYHIPNLPNLPDQKHFRIHYRNFHKYFPYTLCNKLYQREYLLKNRIYFMDYSAKEYAFFNLNVFKNLNSVAFNRVAYCTCQKNKDNQSIGFDANLFEINLELARKFQELLEYWQEEKEFEDLIIGEYYQAVIEEIENACNKESDLSMLEQQEYLNKVLADGRITPFVEKFSTVADKGPYYLALTRAIQSGNGRVVAQLHTRRNDTKETTTKIKNVFGRIINIF